MGAFVEPDEKKMAKAPKFQQLSILGAGVFANILMFIIFVLIMWGFFALSFAPAGITFNTYAQNVVNVSQITHIEDNPVNDLFEISKYTKEGLNEITSNGKKYLAPQELLDKEFLLEHNQIIVFENAPAVNANLEGAISAIDDDKIRSHEDLIRSLESKKPGDVVEILAIDDNGVRRKYEIVLGDREGKSYLGIGFYDMDRKGVSGKLYSLFSKVKDPRIYYEATWDGDFVQFIYDLLWWIVVINILVALMNMLPVSILDGGRFFYLTIWGITGSEKIGKKAYHIAGWFILLLISLMMAKWVLGLF